MKANTTTFKKHGNNYSLITESPTSMLWLAETPAGANFYEVWMKKFYKKDRYTAKEGDILPPSDEQFGISAWNFYDVNRAWVKYARITEGYADILNDLPEEVS